MNCNLAEDLRPTIYTIRIKPGVRFRDDPAFEDDRGRIVTAADFVYSIKRHFDPNVRSLGAWLWADRIVGMAEWRENGARRKGARAAGA